MSGETRDDSDRVDNFFISVYHSKDCTSFNVSTLFGIKSTHLSLQQEFISTVNPSISGPQTPHIITTKNTKRLFLRALRGFKESESMDGRVYNDYPSGYRIRVKKIQSAVHPGAHIQLKKRIIPFISNGYD
jgi:hypothetical protein